MSGDPECLPQLGHVVAVVIVRFVPLVEVDLPPPQPILGWIDQAATAAS